MQSAGSMQSQRTYRLKRNRPKEPLGLVLVSGDKVIEHRPAIIQVYGRTPVASYADTGWTAQELLREEGESRHAWMEGWNTSRRQNHKGKSVCKYEIKAAMDVCQKRLQAALV